MRNLILALVMGVSGTGLANEDKKNNLKVTHSAKTSSSTTTKFETTSSHITVAYERKINKVISLGVAIGQGESSYTSTLGSGQSNTGSAAFQFGLTW